ncbi:MAG: hypothetical protein GY727_03865 [Gammaproteobacteria bacterium]|nr:hypothetical protein [Gammaproteobacteria bacterium]MCP4090510.1 hypothetical protein [Gammaproteobacteria bacterium]MCP4276625.1 hypothetical protein [Gammaproteobacteria bacterium]MCP4831375.1 hypothetical protein [Gammaproteobacteria bacterium]MCP4927919.1 hypothetical protein [Gammaproteobacteria bacterium]
MEKILLLLGFVAMLSSACQTAGGIKEGAPEELGASFISSSISTEGMKPGCFYIREVTDWEALNAVNLIVYTGNKSQAYLVTIDVPAISLRSSSNIAFIGTRDRDRICGRPGERMVVGVGARWDYTVMDVRRLDKEMHAGFLQNKVAAKSKTIEPADESPGAKVETDITPND